MIIQYRVSFILFNIINASRPPSPPSNYQQQQQEGSSEYTLHIVIKWGNHGDNFNSIFLMGGKYGKITATIQLFRRGGLTRVTTGNFL